MNSNRLHHLLKKIIMDWDLRIHLLDQFLSQTKLCKFELAQDFDWLSELVDERPNSLGLDRLINHWISQGRRLELHLVHSMIPNNLKVNHYLFEQ